MAGQQPSWKTCSVVTASLPGGPSRSSQNRVAGESRRLNTDDVRVTTSLSSCLCQDGQLCKPITGRVWRCTWLRVIHLPHAGGEIYGFGLELELGVSRRNISGF